MRPSAAIAILLTIAAVPLRAERVERLWEQRFDVAPAPKGEWRLEKGTEIREGALHTRHDAGIEFSGAQSVRPLRMPTAPDGYLLRFEWALVPVKLGAWGQDTRAVDGPFVVEFANGRPALNNLRMAREAAQPGQQTVLACDFNRHTVFSWKTNGREQLDAPIPAWFGGVAETRFSLGDYKGSGGETRWLWVRLSKVVPDDPLPLLLSAWDELCSPKPGEPASLLIGQASAMHKVFREAGDFPGSFRREVRIAAAGRERESFQLALLPVQKPLKGVRVSVSDLLRQGAPGRLPAGRISWHPVGYVQTRSSQSSLRRPGWWWPDILLPTAPFDAPAGMVQPVWFTVDVPADTPPGAYRGLVTFQARRMAPETVGLELTVRPFSLPLRGKLKTAVSFSPPVWEMWYRPEETRRRLGIQGDQEPWSTRDTEDVLPREKWREVYDLYLSHRLSPTILYSDVRKGQARTLPGREDLQYCYDRGMNTMCLACVDHLPEDSQAADQQMRDLEAYLSDWDRYARERNWTDFTWYVHGFDESDLRQGHETTVDPSIRRIYGMMREKLPRIGRESANPVSAAHAGFFNIWTPLTMQWSAGCDERRAAGDETWAYVACWPRRPYANLFVDYPGTDPRLLMWQCYQHKATGFLYHCANYYLSQENWNKPGPKWPDRPWNTLSFGNGNDGILIYPGRNATPLASTRLENLRDGIEDYEALALLAGLTERIERAGRSPDLVARARQALAVRPEVSKSWTEFTDEPERIAQARAEVDALIEAMQKEGGQP